MSEVKRYKADVWHTDPSDVRQTMTSRKEVVLAADYDRLLERAEHEQIRADGLSEISQMQEAQIDDLTARVDRLRERAEAADLERRYREAVELLRGVRTIGRMDDWAEYTSRVFAFLAEETNT